MADDCVTTFNDLKLKHNMKYIIYKMNDAMTQIEVRVPFLSRPRTPCFQKWRAAPWCEIGDMSVRLDKHDAAACTHESLASAHACST